MRFFLRHRIAACLAAALSGGAFSFALWYLLCRVVQVYTVGGGVRVLNELPPFSELRWLGVLLPLAALAARRRGKMLARLAAATLPWLLLWPLLPLRPGLLQISLMMPVIGWGVFRVGYLFGPLLPKQTIEPGKVRLIVPVLWLACFVFGYLQQIDAHRSLFFIYGDWSQYAEHYLALLSGQASGRAWLAGAGHFNLLVNLVMTGCLALVRRPETIFAVNALMVSSAVPLAAMLARKRGAGPGAALVLAVAAALNPALSHQYLGFIYGFHPIVFMIPLVLGFFLLGKSRWKWALFAASLLVQETAAVFWFGYGLYLLIRRDRRVGLTLVLAMPCWFFVIGHWVMPWVFDHAQYAQVFHYAALGRSLPEVALSPFLRPAEFWGAVAHPRSISFVLCALAPLWFACGARPAALVAVLPLFAGVCMQDSPQVKTIALQYGVEITVWLLVVTAAAWGGSTRAPRRWRFGLPAGGFAAGSVAAALAVTGLSWFLFGFAVPHGKYSIESGRRCSDIRPLIDALTADGMPKRVFAGSRLRNHFLFLAPTLPLRGTPETGDLILMDMNEGMFDTEFEPENFRASLLCRPDVAPVALSGAAGELARGLGIAAYRIGGKAGERPSLPVLSEEAFAAEGEEIPTGSPEFRARVARRDGAAMAIFAVRVERAPEYDVDLLVRVGGRLYRMAFGGGYVPAYVCPAGAVYRFAVPCGGDEPVGFLIRTRAGSAEACQLFKQEKGL